MDFEKAYKLLFNAITNAIIEIDNSKVVTMEMTNGLKVLKLAQCQTEEMYLVSE